jgi:phosphate transporter
MDLEASIASLRSQAAQQEVSEHSQLLPPRGRGNSASRSPIGTARHIANRIFRKDSTASSNPETVWTAKNNYAMDIQLLFKRRITNLYLSVTSLKSYVELNYTGFRKILKK